MTSSAVRIAVAGLWVLPAVAPGRAAEPALSLRERAAEHCPEIIFALRGMGGDGHWYANFGHHSQGYDRMQYGPPGGALYKLNLRTGRLTALLEDAGGGIRDPQVHYDGRKVLFSYRKAGSRYYHLHQIDSDGSNLRQLTDGPFDDIEPIYLPGGELMFCSSRCNRFVQCWYTQVAILYRCGPDGQGIHPVSANVEQDNTPWMMPDGRVLYMRWEYVDRSRVQYHHLWTANPDGTGVMVYYGNMRGGTVMLDAKPIPGTNRVISIFSPGHGQKEHAGRMAIVDPDAGPDEPRQVVFLGHGQAYRDPYPLEADLFLVAEGKQILVMDAAGRTEVLYTAPDGPMMAHEPRPLCPRIREPIFADRARPQEAAGRLILADVTHGRSMEGVRAGEVKKLLVLETLPKPVNFSGTMEPISLGGTFTLPRILGTVPVEADGSAFFEAPALRPLFFVALDANGLSVKRMQSFTSVMPGETTSCSGCHEQRTDTARFKELLATRKEPSRIEPIADVPDVMDFPRDVQPILDRHCVRCHNYAQPPPKGIALVGARGPIYSHSYFALMAGGYVSHGRDAGGNIAPRRIGSSASRLLKQLDGAHNDVKLTALEHKTIRLWIECGAPYPGTYAALGSGMVGAEADAEVLARRCAGCHGTDVKRGARLKMTDDLLYNLSEPARSPLLLAPLAKPAGGWGLCKGDLPRANRRAPGAPDAPLDAVFASTDDSDYRKLLADVESARRNLEAVTRFDMPGFRPNQHYLREMKRYGFLPADADPARQPIDCYAVDQAYWRSFWYRPAQQGQ